MKVVPISESCKPKVKQRTMRVVEASPDDPIYKTGYLIGRGPHHNIDDNIDEVGYAG